MEIHFHEHMICCRDHHNFEYYSKDFSRWC